MKWLAAIALVVAIAGIIVSQARRDDAPTIGSGGPANAPAATGPAASPGAPPASGGGFQPPTARPVLPSPAAEGSAAHPAPVADQYAQEVRGDEHHARETELALRGKLGSLPGIRVDTADCKATICKVAFGGSTAALDKAIETLGSARQRVGSSWVLSAPIQHPDGTLTLTAFVRY